MSSSSLSTEVKTSSSTEAKTSSSSYSVHITLAINHILMEQNHYNLIPFIYYGEDDLKSLGNNLSFSFRTSLNKLNYTAVVNPSIQSPTENTIYVPETEDAYYRNNPIFYLDLITDSKALRMLAPEDKKISIKLQFQNIHLFFLSLTFQKI